MAESSGETGAHVTPDAGTQEDSVGLFQINRLAHDWSHDMDLTDPLQNALAAYRVSGGGENISPWTVTHRSRGNPYTRFRSDALAAAAANGEGGTQGYFDGVSGYGDVQPASSLPGGGPGSPFDLLAAFDRIQHPARGRDGGRDGAAGSCRLASGKTLRGKGLVQIMPGERLVLETPGGGGLGDPRERATAAIDRDVAESRITSEAASLRASIRAHPRAAPKRS